MNENKVAFSRLGLILAGSMFMGAGLHSYSFGGATFCILFLFTNVISESIG